MKMVNLELFIGSFHSSGRSSLRRLLAHALTVQRRRAAAAQHTSCHAAHRVMRGAPGCERDFRGMEYIASSRRRRRDLESGVLVFSPCAAPRRRSAAPRARRRESSSTGVRA